MLCKHIAYCLLPGVMCMAGFALDMYRKLTAGRKIDAVSFLTVHI
jgi:hypothetical protein